MHCHRHQHVWQCTNSTAFSDSRFGSTCKRAPNPSLHLLVVPYPDTLLLCILQVRADQVAEALNGESIPAAALHGGLTQVRHFAASVPPAVSTATLAAFCMT